MTDMDDNEYIYLTAQGHGLSPQLYQDVGESCFENGWTDVFGFITPQGHDAIERYVNG